MKTKITNKTLFNYKINSCFYTNYKLKMQLNFELPCLMNNITSL